MAHVALALEDVGLAVPLQELLEKSGHRVLWSPPLVNGPAGLPPHFGAVDVVVLAERPGQVLDRGLDAWRDRSPPPGILAVVISSAGHDMARRARATAVLASSPPAEIAAAVDRALTSRWSGRLARSYARGALGLEPDDDPVRDAARIIAAARKAGLDLVGDAMRLHTLHYVSATSLVAQLRDARALDIPEVDATRLMDGTRTVQTLVRSAGAAGPGVGRLCWALACVGAVTLTPEPPDLATAERRAVAEARRHLRARESRMERATHYDVLEVTPGAERADVENAGRLLALRYAPDRLAALDLGDRAASVAPLWQAIQRAVAVLADPAEKLRYNERLRALAAKGQLSSAWTVGPHDRERAEVAFARGQRALASGEPFKAVSEMAAAARAHADHPDYEASLAWARHRAELARGKSREDSAPRERKSAEEALLGRRPWARALVALAFLCAADEDPDAARWHLREALRCDPNLPVARQLLARLGK